MTTSLIVDQETAEKEINAWLDAKCIENDEREEKAQFIKVLVNGVKRGYLTIDPVTFEMMQTLKFPIGALTSLKYKARAGCGELQAGTRNINGISMGVYVAYAAALTGELTATLSKLDSEDFKILQAITTFFL